jgi:putative ABC transport system substrate-binding protein
LKFAVEPSNLLAPREHAWTPGCPTPYRQPPDRARAAWIFRWADAQYDLVPAIAAELVGRRVAVIVANTPGNLVAKAATTTIPIVFTIASDPVQIGLVASLARPGGNVTGATQLGVELVPKQLELAHELVPTATVIAALVTPNNPNAETLSRDLQAAARILGVQLHVLHASTERDFDTVFATLVQLRTGALVIGTDPSPMIPGPSRIPIPPSWPGL